MKDMPFFSVLISNFNNGKYLMEAIDSVINQTYSNWEIVLVDDCSTDNSKELYKNIEKDSRISIFYNELNMGCGYTKRKCVELAKGEICGFLDPDDTLFHDALSAMIDVHQSNSEVSVVYSRCKLCDVNLNEFSENKFLRLNDGETYFDYRHKFGILNFATFKKEFYQRTEGISSQIKAGVDQDLYFKMEEVGGIYVLNQFTYNYRLGVDGAITSNFLNLWFWNFIVRYNTCMRRNLNPEKYILQDFEEILNMYAGEKILECEKRIRSTFQFRFGRLLISPFRFVRKVFK